MSCSDRRLARAVVSLAALALLGGTAGCGSDATAEASTAATPTATTADATTRRLAEVEWARQCTVDLASHADEQAFTTDLDARLAEAGFTHEQWKKWHDALAGSPELISQFAEVSAPGCPAA
ncbi:hypothetical protein DQ239_18285 [Blastococcus sp. TF02-09]|uniref:hypothetical protein n=1 Tax=Blastococcus sp. TF02-09 TaxID=2250576 RepID=UPI000DE94544|nr:hypothetical protein [Blastococcus sp. TF02-9]RBY74976.1 hypothetical protein DQ239_18285 [Blastococcus sp. TF02-9]